eukprot:gene7028-9607_t
MRSSSIKAYNVTNTSSYNAGLLGGSIKWTLDIDEGDYHVIEFKHSGILGTRVVVVDDEFVIKRNKCLKLVGRESFTFGSTYRHYGEILVEPSKCFGYIYTLYIDGAPYTEFIEFRRTQQHLLSVSSLPRVFQNPDYNVSTPL